MYKYTILRYDAFFIVWWCDVLTICCCCINLVYWTGNVMCVAVCIRVTKQFFGDRGWVSLLHLTVEVYPRNSSLNHKAMLRVLCITLLNDVLSSTTRALFSPATTCVRFNFGFHEIFWKAFTASIFIMGFPLLGLSLTDLGCRWVNSLLVSCGKYRWCFKFSSYWCWWLRPEKVTLLKRETQSDSATAGV